MAKLSKEEADQLAALKAKEEAPDEPEGDDDQGDDDGHVVVLRGSRADAFLASFMGPAKPAKKAAPAKATKEQPAEEEAEAEEEPAPKPVNRYFR